MVELDIQIFMCSIYKKKRTNTHESLFVKRSKTFKKLLFSIDLYESIVMISTITRVKFTTRAEANLNFETNKQNSQFLMILKN